MEKVYGAMCVPGQNGDLRDGEVFGEGGARGAVSFESREDAFLFDSLAEDPDQLGLLAVDRERDARAVVALALSSRHLLHDLEEVPEVVVLAHRVAPGVAGGAGEVEAFVEHVVLEGGDSVLGDEAFDLAYLLPDHRRQMVAVVHAGVSLRGLQDLREDLRVRTTLFEIVAPGPEVAYDARHPTRERRERLALRILREVAVDAEVEVRVHGPREHQLALGVDGFVGIAYPFPYRRDSAVLDPDVRPDQSRS